MNSITQVSNQTAAPTPEAEERAWTPMRRDFLRMLGIGGGAAALGPLTGCGSADAASTSSDLATTLATDKAYWSAVHEMFTLNPGKTFMNIGTAGSMPRVVQDVFDRENRLKAYDSLHGYSNHLALRTRVAPGFGVDPDELAFSANTSSGMCHSILGIDWKPGDVVVTTNHEHGGGLTPLNIAVARYGIEVSMVPMPIGNGQKAEDYVTLFEDRIKSLQGQGKRVRAMMFSAPTYKTGTMLPIALLMEVVKKYSLISIVDGAHLPGSMALNYADLGMDFMAGAGHKWQCGPGSTGILIVRNKIRASNPLPLPKWYPIHTSSYPADTTRTTTGTATYDIGSVITSCGSTHTPLFTSLTTACELWDSIGRKKIETYILTLGSYLKELISERWGVDRLYSPKDDARLLSPVTSFNPFVKKEDVLNATKSTAFITALANEFNPNLIIRNVNVPVPGSTDHYVARVSTHLWASASDVERLVDAMWNLSRKMG